MFIVLMLTLIFLGISLIVTLFSVYYFQIKEYRFDRLAAALKEQGILYFLLPERVLFPKKSVRNMNIFMLVGLLLISYNAMVLLSLPTSWYKAVFIFVSPLATLIFVSIGVIITEVISQSNRAKTIILAQKVRATSKAVFIGVTGSFGKSSTKEYLYQVLSSKYKTGKTIGNYNTNIGVAMSVNQNLTPDTEFFVTEMGAYKIGEIKAIADWIQPSYAVISGLSNQHLSLFGSIENLINAKGELIQALPDGSSVYINSDCSEYKTILQYAQNKKVILYSAVNPTADVFLQEFTPNHDYTHAKILYKSNTFDITTKLKGLHNFVNLLPVVAIASDLNISKSAIEASITKLHNPFGKLSEHKVQQGTTYIYDGYSSNIVGFLSAIEVLSSYQGKNKYIVTKGIIELGNQKSDSYRKVLTQIEKHNITLITSDQLFKKLSQSALVQTIKSEQQILNFIKSIRGIGTVVLIEGRFSDKFVSALDINE